MTNEVLHGECAVEENGEAFDRVNEREELWHLQAMVLAEMKDSFCLGLTSTASVFSLFSCSLCCVIQL